MRLFTAERLLVLTAGHSPSKNGPVRCSDRCSFFPLTNPDFPRLLNSSAMAKPVLCLLASTTFLATTLAAVCYHPDGSPAPSDYQPCDPSAAVSMCCRIGGNSPHNVCQPYGLCLELDNNVLWRESCTDKAWGPHCLHLCTDKSGIVSSWPCKSEGRTSNTTRSKQCKRRLPHTLPEWRLLLRVKQLSLLW
jgi:hypothetical protein